MKLISQTLTVLFVLSALAQSDPAAPKPTKTFDALADTALLAMSKRAEELKIKGVAVVAYAEGENVNSWSSKMAVVGAIKNPPTEKDRGANLLAIAYSKAAEMAVTLKDSGNAGRPAMTGENGWQGGLIRKANTGYLIAAFSGGPSASDVEVSRAGLKALVGKLAFVRFHLRYLPYPRCSAAWKTGQPIRGWISSPFCR